MLFTSATFFLYFMPVALIGFQLCGKLGRRPVIAWLAFMSFVFYAYWNWHLVALLVGSMLFNFAISRGIYASRHSDRVQRVWLWVGIAGNLAALGYFKYLFPMIGFLHRTGLTTRDLGTVVLPLGISFFTFTQIGYLVDLSQGEATAQGFLEYALFVTFFPHLIAGPILHHKEMMPQFSADHRFHLRSDDMLLGASWFILGLAKKSIIADQLAGAADTGFKYGTTMGAAGVWLTVIVYSMQLYFDFSGYSDMAIGLARMFSIRFPLNFNSPFKAASIIEFWQRWHITLTRYLTLYLYNPISLSVNRKRMATGRKVSRKASRTLPGFLHMLAWPTIATMFIAGVWHGAGIRFIIFGVLHGIYLSVNHAWRIFRGESNPTQKHSRVSHAASVLLTYACVLLALVFFRANTTADAYSMAGRMFGLHGLGFGPHVRLKWIAVLGLFPIVWFLPNTQEILGESKMEAPKERAWARAIWHPTWGWSVAIAVVFVVALAFIQNAATFLYFQF